MLQISKKLIICLTSILLIVTCASCKTDAPYLIKDYLNYLAINSGIGTGQIIETNFEDLLDWKIVSLSDKELLDDALDYRYLTNTINALLENDDNSLDELIKLGIVDKNVDYDDHIDEETACRITNKAIEIINNKTFKSKYEYTIIDDDDVYYDDSESKYKIYDDGEYRDAQFEEVFSSYDISDSYVIDFSNAEVIPYQDESDNTSYINNKYQLLANNNHHVFNNDGFRISYSLNSSGISVHVSKTINDMNVFGHLDIKNVKPSFKWTYKENDFKNCYFNLKMDTSEEFGVSDGRYGKRYLSLKDLDSSSFSSLVKSMFVKDKDRQEAVIPICQIKTPFPNIPNAYLNFDVLLKFYVSGKVELVLYNTHNFGFEIKEGKSRFFYDHDDDFDAIARASGKACLGLNVGIDAATYRLCDVEFDGGLKAELKTTMHMYDNDGNMTSENVDIAYDVLEQLSEDNPNIKVCGDVSFYWMFDVILNTSKSVLYKMGFTKVFHVLDENNQVFGNLHHIEDGMFVEKCTRKSNKKGSSTPLSINAYDKIVLNSYAEVLIKGETFKIELKSLPSGYSESDIRYSSSDNNVAKVNDGTISAINYGNSKIKVYTKDNKYNTYINILVSTG